MIRHNTCTSLVYMQNQTCNRNKSV